MRDYSAIPQELKDLKQWVCVAMEPPKGKDKKPRKVPMCGPSRRASVTDPSTWLTFVDAVSMLHAHPEDLKHVGFVFTADDGYLGVDMDGVVDPSTGRILKEAQDIVAKFRSYTEYSVSGKGLHIIIKAEKPGSSCRKSFLEMYDRGRYFIFSGQTLADSEPAIRERQAELDEFYDEWWPSKHDPMDELDGPLIEVPVDYDTQKTTELVCQDQKTALLFAGEFSTYESQSSADLALCIRLYSALKDADKVDAVFRASGLMRPKWDEKRGALTYGQKTLRAAAEAVAKAPQTKTTHEDYADAVIASLCKDGVSPIKQGDKLYSYASGIWKSMAKEAITNMVAKEYNKELKKQQEYGAVAKRALEKLPDFTGAFDVNGLAFGDSIVKISNGAVQIVKLSPTDYARHAADYVPAPGPTPAFDQFMAQSFSGGENQIPLVQELIGLTLTSGLTAVQKCVVLYGPGASGKSVLIALIESLFPNGLRAAIPPSNWNNEYYIDALCGAKLNTTSELPSRKRVEAEHFKRIVSGDAVQARQVYGKAYSGRVNASHWFSCNALPVSDDLSSGWFRRFTIVDMPNAVPEDRRDPELLNSLLKERAAIAMWALAGAARYAMTGSLTRALREPGSTGSVSDMLVEEWREDQDTLGRWYANTDISQFATWEEMNAAYRHYCQVLGETPQSARSVRKLWLNSGKK